MPRGGARPNSGRKKDVKTSDKTEIFYKRVTPEEKEALEKFIKDLRS